MITSGGSRISRWGGGRRPPTRTLFGETYAKTKEMDPVGGSARRRPPPPDPPMITVLVKLQLKSCRDFNVFSFTAIICSEGNRYLF